MSSEEIEAQRKEKQNFLKKEIIEEGYEGSKFEQFLKSKKDEGDNIDIWSITELYQLVVEFKTQLTFQSLEKVQTSSKKESISSPQEVRQQTSVQPSQSKDDIIIMNNQPSKPQEESKEPVMNASNVNMMASNAINTSIARKESTKTEEQPKGRDSEDFFQKKQAIRVAKKSQLNETNLPIMMNNVQTGRPELVKGGIFSASYIQYKVSTNPFKWVVKRKYSDFLWLRNTLAKFFPAIPIAPLPTKNSSKKLQNDQLRKRMYLLESFLNGILTHDELKTSPYLIGFLKEDSERFKTIMKDSEKFVRPTTLDQMFNIAGQTVLEINPDLKGFAQNAGELTSQTEPIYKRIKKLGKQLVTDLDQVSNTIFNIGECYGALYQSANIFNKNVTIGKNNVLSDIYLALNNQFVSWGSNFKARLTSLGEEVLGQIKLIRKHINYFYKYEAAENEAFKEILKNRSSIGTNYVQKRRELLQRKEKLFAANDMTKWEILPQKLKDYSKDELLKNRNLAYDVMLPKVFDQKIIFHNKETEQCNEMKDLFAFYNATCFNEINRGLLEKCKNYAKNFFEMAKGQADLINELHISWGDLQAQFTQMKPGKSTIIKDRMSVLRPEQQYHMEGAVDD